MSGAQDLLLGNFSTAAVGYQIERSLRFNSADSAYLNRTNGGAGSTTTGTLSLWVKRGDLGTERGIFATNVGASVPPYLRFPSDNTLRFSDGSGGTFVINTTQVFRDVSAWYHIVVACDTTQGTSSNRIKIYVNGTQVTALSTATYPGSSTTISWTAATSQFIGQNSSSASYFNGYMTEVNFIDGQQLAPSDFGETDSATGVWEPIAYSGTYGTNGFYLPFSDNASTTTLGDDFSGNNNDWTPNNFSVTAGAGNDSLVDSPTAYGTDTGVGGEVRGNYCTMNPLQYSSTYVNLRNGNLDVSGASGVDAGGAFATAKVNSGKWYWEALILGTQSTYPAIGFAVNTTGAEFQGGARVNTSGTLEIAAPESFITLNGSPSGTSFTTNDVLQFALDMDNGKMWVGKNNTWMNSGVPASGTGNMFSISDTSQYVSPYIFSYNASSVAYNFGQRAFAYTAPSGFKALVTTNLPTPTIGATSTTQANDYFDVVLWTGDGASPRSFTGWGFAPDLIWIKSRSNTANHALIDIVRGTGSKVLNSELTAAESGDGLIVNSFDSNGFTGATGSINFSWANQNTLSYVGWGWKAGGTGSSNTSGTITSTVSANTTSGFSIVTYTGTGSAATIGHGLGAVPSMFIVKNRDAADAWQVYHAANTAAPETDYLVLNTTAATADAADRWNDTLPTSTVFSIGNGVEVNTNTEKYVAYCFSEVPGYSAMGSYTGNGSADGPFVYTNHRPAFLLVKRTDTTSNWTILDFQREGYNVDNDPLFPNLSNAEGTTDLADILSNGFKLRSTDASVNASGGTYIYMSLASNPFKFSLAR